MLKTINVKRFVTIAITIVSTLASAGLFTLVQPANAATIDGSTVISHGLAEQGSSIGNGAHSDALTSVLDSDGVKDGNKSKSEALSNHKTGIYDFRKTNSKNDADEGESDIKLWAPLIVLGPIFAAMTIEDKKN